MNCRGHGVGVAHIRSAAAAGEAGRDTAADLLAQLHDASTAFPCVASADNPVLQATKECFDAYDEALSALAEYKPKVL
jgi:hypothetical protein